MTERLFGLETEYAFTALDGRGRPVDSMGALRDMMEIAQAKLPHLCDGTSRGMFLACGARFYIDAPDHPEFSTPEVSNPWDAVRYLQAGDRIVEQLAAEVAERDLYVDEVVVSRCNVDLGGTGATWGSHESVLHRTADTSQLATQLIPFLVSRIVFAGAGGFNSLRLRALQFTLSPRVWHLMHAVSGGSTESRGIFHTKDESHASAGYHRLHILCGESTCSETSTWLKVATTVLVVALIDAGYRLGDAVRLKLPLAAMRRFACDPTCSVVAKTVHGRFVSALAVQRHSLEQVEAHLDDAIMPSWAAEACRRWREILESLERGPEAVSTRLDWAIKLALYKARARKAGVPWETVPYWNHVVTVLDRQLRLVHTDTRASVVSGRARARMGLARWSSRPVRFLDFGQAAGWPPVDEILRSGGTVGAAVKKLSTFLARHDLEWAGLPAFIALRDELFEIDTRFSQLGAKGIFAALDRAGVLAHRIPGVDDIEHAMENPPVGGRAGVRGEYVRRLAGEPARYLCDWRGVFDTQQVRRLDLSDPFVTSAQWQPWQPGPYDLDDLRASLTGGVSF